MSSELRRLLRLARAQSDMASLLEHKLRSEDARLRELEATKSGTLAALERACTAGLVFYAAALKRLTEIDTSLATSERVRGGLGTKLLQARHRQETLLRRAGELQVAIARKTNDEEARDTALAMHEKATGKDGVLK